MWWSSLAVVGEADGHVKYDGRFGDPAVALRARHRRDRRLREAGARAVLHWTWDDVASPDALSHMLRGAGLPLVAPRDTFHLQGLAALLRSSPVTPAAPPE